jgi:hypothetical protein
MKKKGRSESSRPRPNRLLRPLRDAWVTIQFHLGWDETDDPDPEVCKGIAEHYRRVHAVPSREGLQESIRSLEFELPLGVSDFEARKRAGEALLRRAVDPVRPIENDDP